MSEAARAIIELVDRAAWSELTPEDHRAMRAWLLGAQPYDLYMILLHARGVWRRQARASSTSQTMRAIVETTSPPSVPPPGGEE